MTSVPGPWVRSVGTAVPPHCVDQETLIAAFRELWAAALQPRAPRGAAPRRRASAAGTWRCRSSEYPALERFSRRATTPGSAWRIELGERAVRGRWRAAGLAPTDVDHLFFVTVTGIATPSHRRAAGEPARAAPRRQAHARSSGSAAWPAPPALRARQRLRCARFPDRWRVLLAVELCSLTLQREDLSIPNIIASRPVRRRRRGGGPRRRPARAAGGPRVVATPLGLLPGHRARHGLGRGRHRLQGRALARRCPSSSASTSAADVDGFLADAGAATRATSRTGSRTPAGPKVLAGVRGRRWSCRPRRSQPLVGLAAQRSATSPRPRCSSCSRELLAASEARPGDLGLLMAMGPGFCAELVLLQW